MRYKLDGCFFHQNRVSVEDGDGASFCLERGVCGGYDIMVFDVDEVFVVPAEYRYLDYDRSSHLRGRCYSEVLHRDDFLSMEDFEIVVNKL